MTAGRDARDDEIERLRSVLWDAHRAINRGLVSPEDLAWGANEASLIAAPPAPYRTPTEPKIIQQYVDAVAPHPATWVQEEYARQVAVEPKNIPIEPDYPALCAKLYDMLWNTHCSTCNCFIGDMVGANHDCPDCQKQRDALRLAGEMGVKP